MATFQEEEAKEGRHAEPTQRILGGTAQEACFRLRHCAHRLISRAQHLGALEYPSCLDLSVCLKNQECMSGRDKRLKKAADMSEEGNRFSTVRCQKH